MTTEGRTRLAESHKQNISDGVKRRWEQRRKINKATAKVVEAARDIAPMVRSDQLTDAIKKLDRALAGS